jgi:hypothetical protein
MIQVREGSAGMDRRMRPDRRAAARRALYALAPLFALRSA